jgi:GxxExxY protein
MNRIVDDKLLLIQEVYTIIGVAIEVHRILGRGFLEAVYQEALGVEFAKRNIPHVAQQTLTIEYKGTVLRSV